PDPNVARPTSRNQPSAAWRKVQGPNGFFCYKDTNFLSASRIPQVDTFGFGNRGHNAAVRRQRDPVSWLVEYHYFFPRLIIPQGYWSCRFPPKRTGICHGNRGSPG